MKYILPLLWVTLLIADNIYGQTRTVVKYDYDQAGNRIKRSIKIETLVNGNYERKGINADTLLMNTEVYPNPTFGSIHVNLQNLKETDVCTLFIIDINGNYFLKKIISSSQNELDLNSYANGVYILQVVFNSTKKDWKIMKE